MARQQLLNSVTLNATTTPAPLSAASITVTSVTIQNPITNTDFIRIGNAAQQRYAIAPGKEMVIEGDKLDNGTQAYVNLNSIFVVAASGSQTVNATYLERF